MKYYRYQQFTTADGPRNLVENALLRGDSDNNGIADDWSNGGGVISSTLADGTQTFVTNTTSTYAGMRNSTGHNIPVPKNHIMYLRVKLKSSFTTTTLWILSSKHPTISNTSVGSLGAGYESDFRTMSFKTSAAWASDDLNIYIRVGTSSSLNTNQYPISFKEPMVIDLTATFGAGNEPSKTWCDENIPFFDGVYGYNLITADNHNFHVRYNDGYFVDTENSQENLNTVSFGSYSFSGNKIKALKLHYESGLLTDRLAIDTLSAEIESDTRPTITRYTPITVQRNGSVMGVFFNGQIKELGERRYSLYAESYLALLDYDYHYGGMYTAVNAGTVIADIMGNLPYTIHPDVAALKLYGYLPYATKRENLLQVLISTGAAVAKNANGTMHITVLSGTSKGTFTDSRIFTDGVLDEDTQVTAVQVTEHAYAPIQDEITLFTESFTDIRTAIFTEPAHSLSITGGTILESSINHAKIQGAGAVTLTGKKYRHTTKIVTRGNVLGTPDDKILSVTNATLITAINSSAAAQRLYSYAKCNKTVKQDVLINQERTGDMVQVAHPYKEDILSAAIHSLDYNLSNLLRASGEFLVDYVPQGISGGYQHRVILTTNGNWTVPAGVTEIRAVLIGGGQGGTAGENGTDGSRAANRTRVNDLSRAAGGKGGKGKSGGAGGKIYETTVTVTPGQTISRSIGQGGNGGLSNGAEGSLGTATVFGNINSDLGTAGEYVDAMTAERFAFQGDTGINGADADVYSNQGGDVTGPPEPGWPYGRTYLGGTHGTEYTEYLGSTRGWAGGAGGKGGGAAVGDNGVNGSNGNVTSNDTAIGGDGGRGGNAAARSAATVYGAGGDGGHGGGGGGGGGDSVRSSDLYANPGLGGVAGLGGAAGKGANGCIIIYY